MSKRVTELPTETEHVAWPQAWGESPAMLGTRAPKPHILTPHRLLDSLSIPDLESHFPQDWRLSLDTAMAGQS